jgi:AcrR family transcriptional regulator
MAEDQRIVQTRAAVLAAALTLIAEAGLEGATIERISERSGVARSTIYRRWPEPAQLYVDALFPVTVVAEQRPTGDLAADLGHYLDDYAHRLNDPTYLGALVAIIARAARDPEFAALHRAMVDTRRSRAAALLSAAQASGTARPDLSLDDAVEAVHSPFLYIRLIRHDPITADDQARLLAGLVARFGSP